MATTAPSLFVCLLLCLCCASCLRAHEDQLAAGAGAGGYRVRAVTVDQGGARLRAQLAAVAGGGNVSAAGYGEDVQNLDVYAS
ncbi:hypothetical protein EJB05_41950 [Eragrostis curvula]|uniref:Uncharacterized protein n=1 Tax=Eragrostis curvula TaxID=38414 RepID=A0A5J9TB53_9POAL|nr:hypothetical protein EJB05_41950 [Eragrostis curvula]